ncbi:hypothetical protein QB607_003178 [Clostridium botulinum]|nr:hypothetical protein [Clostridium botulinum]EKS4395851.1 hypothetical protein [Clostridium botulinum]
MEILSQNSNSKKVYNSNKIGTISSTSYITVKLLGKTWKVKKQAENKWIKVAKIEDLIRNNLSDVLGAISIAVAGLLIYCLMFMYS